MFVNGDLDCLDSTNQQIEIKCQLLGMRNERQHYYITPFWYAEAVLLKTETIVVAERLKDNSVISVKRVHINELETGGENFDASGMVWTPGNKEKKLKWTWTKDKLFGHVEEFVNKIYDLLQSDKYFNKIVVIQKEPQKSTFFIAEVDHNSSRLFPVEFQDHFRQSERLKIRPLALPWEKN
ncbi:hypothetical protein L596_022708 [Steinernema carpocapsae]|uniref:Decapping nuclease n=1 Tax=Steinernema carpocapsae TaxID=34508 RepID=A0A4U5MML3_STECR|nr:hypothetical protein L596_022708 [Steinernema carpocapsae]